ncbi:hypothetical protein DL240_12610 [Lujinxingia litoralis]|uniref:hydroxyacylglutathione hydrolase n=1 Tax=Lujinxingia litoralis TaxID=2211119 RepID=A0A328C4M2_9DELT|nr:MBL fold metallo-hydrolase [Lujinxingia litoralis]RAL21689.1 hypothetical protein DL240_12610 [Lujinxingia litoralis]
MKIEIIRSSVSDNFFYGVADTRGRAALIDPVDAQEAIERVRQCGWELVWVINTHWHPDHVLGNVEVLDAFPEAQVVGPSGDRARIDAQFEGAGRGGVEVEVRGGQTLEVGSLKLDVIDTPGHTAGHVSFLCGDHLFSGDVIFAGGAGHCRAADADVAQHYQTFAHVLSRLPGSTHYYPGHDYTVRNCEFVLSIEPEHQEAQRVLEVASAQEPGTLFESTLGQERRYNPFMRLDEQGLRQALATRYGDQLEAARAKSSEESEAIFRCVRALRDQW